MLLGNDYVKTRRALEKAWLNRTRGITNIEVHRLARQFFIYSSDREYFIDDLTNPPDIDHSFEDPMIPIEAWIGLETSARLKAMGYDGNLEVVMPDDPCSDVPAPDKA